MTSSPPVILPITLNDQLARDITNAVIAAIGQTFATEVLPKTATMCSGSVTLNGDISGIVGVVQERLEGTLTVCFKMETIQELLPHLLGHDIEITSDVAMDAVGELTNMIFGQVKTELNARGHNVRFGLPSVVKGRGHFIGHMHDGASMLIPFLLGGRDFYVHFAYHAA